MTGPHRAAHGPATAGPALTLRAKLAAEHHAGPPGGGLRAFLEVGASGLNARPGGAPAPSVVLIVDCSGSMAQPPGDRFPAVRHAARAAVDDLPDGTRFALLQGSDPVRLAYPPGDGPELAYAAPGTRAAGRRAAAELHAAGGTDYASWLLRTRELLEGRPEAAPRHAVLLTDSQAPAADRALEAALTACAGVYTCDVLAVGRLLPGAPPAVIAERLGGRALAVPAREDGGLTERLTGRLLDLTAAVLGRPLPELTVCVRPASRLRVAAGRQLVPDERDLPMTALPGDAGDAAGAVAFATGPWGEETRWFEVRLVPGPGGPAPEEAPAGPGPGQWWTARALPRLLPRLLARLRERLRALRGRAAPRAVPVGEIWLAAPADRAALPEPVTLTAPPPGEPPPPEEPHGEPGAPEAIAALRRGCEAYGRADAEAARSHVGTAVRLGHRLGAERLLAAAERLVVVEDAAAGRVRVRAEVSPPAGAAHDDAALPAPAAEAVGGPGGDVSGGEHGAGRGGADGAAVRCGACAVLVPPGNYCRACGERWGAGR